MTAVVADPVPIDRPADIRWWLGWGLIALGIGLASNSLLGPLGVDRIDYPVSESMRNQTIGLDAATLVVVAPLTVAIGVLALRGHGAAPALALGPTSYGAYMLVQYIAGPDHLSYPGVLLLQLAVFIGSWSLAAVAWRLARQPPLRVRLGRWHGLVAWALAGFVLLRYLPGLAGSLSNEPLPPEAAGDPAMYWLIVLLDLGVFVPIAAVAGLGLRRGRPWATTLHRGAVGWFTLVTVAVATMSATMWLNDDRYASAGQLTLFVGLSVVMLVYAAVVHRPLLTAPGPATTG